MKKKKMPIWLGTLIGITIPGLFWVFMISIIMSAIILPLKSCNMDFFKNDEVPTRIEVEEYIKKKYGDNNEITSVKEKEIIDTEYRYPDSANIYTVHSSLGFDYIVDAGISYYEASGGIGSRYEQYYKDTFYTELFKNKKDEIDNLFNKNINFNSTYQIDNDKLVISIELGDIIENVDGANDFLYDLKRLFNETYNIKSFDDINLKYTYKDKYLTSAKLSDLNLYDKDIYKEFVKQYFLINNDIENYIPTYITKLYINSQEYVSEKYEVNFVYNPFYKEYLAMVGYGIEFEYNGGVKDYMQREIITNYLNGTYNINDSQNKTTYTIGTNNYEIYFPQDSKSGVKTGYYFKRNNNKLNISVAQPPLYYGSTGATYFYYLKLSDWADLMNCNYDIKDNSVYLTSK